MNNIIPFENINVEKLSDEFLSDFDTYLLACFREACDRTNGNTPIYKAKEYAITKVTRKFNLTIDKAQEIIREIQMRKIDNELGQE
jgi:hypothetical protein